MSKIKTAAELRALHAQAVTEAKRVMESAGEDGILSPESLSEFNTKMAHADAIKDQLEAANRLEAVQSYMSEPGQAKAAGFGWGGEARPGEGVIPGVTGDDSHLGGVDKQGDAKAQMLASGEYKDAINAYVRKRGNFYNMTPSQQKVLQEGVDTSGGFWVPVDQRAEVVKKMATITGVRQDVYRFPVGTDLVKFPKVVYTTDDQYTAGTRFGWTAEAPSADISEATNPVAGEVDIPVHTATCAVILTRALIEDNVFDVLGYISDLIGETFALGENDACITGTGVGQLQGINNYADASTAHSSGGMYVPTGSSGAVAWGTASAASGILGLEAALPPQYEGNAKFYATKQTYAAMRAINITTAGFQWDSSDSYPNFRNGMSPSLLGYPIVKDQFVPALASNSLSVIFGDLRGYYMPERVGLGIQVFDQIRGLRDQIVVYARRRIGGQLVQPWRVKLAKAATS